MRTLVVLTGGTFGSVRQGDYLSAGTTDDQLERLGSLLAGFPEVQFSFTQPFSKLSENMHPNDWEAIFAAILEKRGEFDNVVVVHGTDTMAYSAAAVAYLNAVSLQTTIVFTGANRPISDSDTDALVNFRQAVLALKYFSEQTVSGCFIVFNGESDGDTPGRIHPAVRVKKDKWDHYCYRSFYVNSKEQSIGEVVGSSVRFDFPVYERLLDSSVSTNLASLAFAEKSVCGIKIFPGLNPEDLPLPNSNRRCFLIELYNSGTAPADGSEFDLTSWVSKVTDAGGLVFAISQHEGKSGLSMNIYETSGALLDAGVIPLGDMIWEAAVPKLMLAARNFSNNADVRDFMLKNIAGEIK